MQNLGGQRECIMGRGIRKQSILTKNGIYVTYRIHTLVGATYVFAFVNTV